MSEAILRFAMEALTACTEQQRTVYMLNRGLQLDGTTRPVMNVSEIARSLGVARPTAYAYLKQAEAAVNQRIALGVLGLSDPIATPEDYALIMSEDPSGAVTEQNRINAELRSHDAPLRFSHTRSEARDRDAIEHDLDRPRKQGIEPQAVGMALEVFHQKHLKRDGA
jgi:hypothetical protein